MATQPTTNIVDPAATNLNNIRAWSGNTASALSNPDFAAYAVDNGIDLNKLSVSDVDSMYSGDFADLQSKGLYNGGGNTTSGSDPFSMSGVGGLALGVGQLGLGLMSYLDNKKTADKQRALMDQQYANNDYAMRKTRADNQHILNVFNPKAASTAKDGVVNSNGLAAKFATA